MGSGCSISNPVIILIPLNKYDFEFLSIKEAGIGAYFIDQAPALNSSLENIRSKMKSAIIPHELLIRDSKVCKKVRKSMIFGIPNDYRWELWKAFLNIKPFDDYHLLPMAEKTSGDIALILKDINRTFPFHSFFDKEKFGLVGQFALYRVLGKFALMYPRVGYCQGMNYIVGFLLMVSGGKENEVLAFFIKLCEHFNLFDAFSDGMKELHKNLWVFDKLFESVYPDLHLHFLREEITEDVWVFKWFLSLFTTVLPENLVVRVWDYFISKGLKALFEVSLGLLSLLKSDLMRSDLTEILNIFEDLHQTHFSEKSLLKAVLKAKVRRSKIEKLRLKYDTKNHRKQPKVLEIIIEKPSSASQPYPNMVVQEITETLDDLPPFQQKSKSGFSTPYHRAHNAFKGFEYYNMGQQSIAVEERTPNEDEIVNAQQFLDELVSEKASGDSFIIQICGNK